MRWVLLLGTLLALGAGSPGHLAIGAPAWPDVAALHGLLKTRLPQLPAPTSGETNAEAYLQSLRPLVLLPEEDRATGGGRGTEPLPLVAKTNLYPGGVAYLRVSRVAAGLAGALENALQPMRGAAHPPLAGVVLDLRFASGDDFAAAAEAASLFVNSPKSGFKLGDQVLNVAARGETNRLPVMLLAHRQTRGAAEVLAALVREMSVPCLLIGTNTAGEAQKYQELEIPGGGRLGVAVPGTRLTLPGGRDFPTNGLGADVPLNLPESEETLYFADEYRRVVRGKSVVVGSSLRMNEAELVRRRRTERVGPGTPTLPGSGRGSTPSIPPAAPRSVQDPALALALDLLISLGEARAGEPDRVSR